MPQLMNGNSYVELNVDQCSVANNGNEELRAGGIEVAVSNRASISITSSTLSSNNNGQVRVLENSGVANVTIFNSTIRDTSAEKQVIGAYFQVDGVNAKDCMFIDLIQNFFEDNDVAISIQGGACSYHIHLNRNLITSSEVSRKK